MQSKNQKLLGVVLALLAVVAAYVNHFQNGFHFDDFHTVSQNVYIQNLRNVPRFFTDARLFSTLPTLCNTPVAISAMPAR